MSDVASLPGVAATPMMAKTDSAPIDANAARERSQGSAGVPMFGASFLATGAKVSTARNRPIVDQNHHEGCRCRLPRSWDRCQGFSATSMGPPGCR